MTLFRTSLFALSMISGAAFAQGSLDQVLTQKEGLTLVSDGLYADKHGTEESYVATSQAGRQALATVMSQHRAMMERHYSTNGIDRAERLVLNEMDTSIAELSRSGAKMDDEDTGNCGTTQVLTRATANGGITASSYAVASNPGGAVAATTNFASTMVGGAYKNHNAVGAAPASVSDANPTSCHSASYAQSFCPGSWAGVASYAYSYRIGPGCYSG